MLWTVNRDDQNAARTYGTVLRADGSRFGNSLELPWRNNAPDISCIPGNLLYFLDLIYSPKHGGARFAFRNVVARLFCEVHAANIVAQLLGCMALGDARVASMSIPGYPAQDGVASSHDAVLRFMTECGIPNYLSLNTPELVTAFVAAKPDVCTIQMQLNDPPLLQVLQAA